MRTVIIIYFCVAILPSIFSSNAELRKQLEEMANQKGIIDGIFQPAEGGYLGIGAFALTFKGTLLKPNKMDVAMKFTPLKNGAMAEREYETYTYLGAINDTDVEQYGIPAVYYYRKWQNYILMAITLLDSEYTERLLKRKLKDVDILIIAREFMKISKYIHSRGVHHSDIKLDNLMFRKHQGFIIDFNFASRLHRENSALIFGIPPENVYQDRRRFAKVDWAGFLHSICVYIGVKFKWFDHCTSHPVCQEKIDEIKNEGFRRVFKEMARNAFKDEINQWTDKGKHKLADFQDTTGFPLYDELYQIISEEMDKLKLAKPVLVSWLTEKERDTAKEKIKELPDIASIKDHFENVDAEYPEVNYNYFAKMNEEKRISEPYEESKNNKAELTKITSTTSSVDKKNKNIFSRSLGWLKCS